MLLGRWQSGSHDALRTVEATEDVLLRMKAPREHIPHCQMCEGWLCGSECSHAGWLWRGVGGCRGCRKADLFLVPEKSLLTSIGWAPLWDSEFSVGRSITVESDDKPSILKLWNDSPSACWIPRCYDLELPKVAELLSAECKTNIKKNLISIYHFHF